MGNQEEERCMYFFRYRQNQQTKKSPLGSGIFCGVVLISIAINLGIPHIVFGVESLPAFPGAEGFGAHTAGGRSGQIHAVTNLNDNGPGSLRACTDALGPRICVFRTGGLITLESSIEIENPFITIAGQSAPGGGISIRTRPDYPKAAIKINTHDVVIRYLRIRPGAGYVIGETQDAITIANNRQPVYNVIIDHTSLSWASDEVANVWYDAHDITFQWNIISEGLNCMNHKKGCHSKGLLVGSDGGHSISIHHNLFAHNTERNPRIAITGIADVVNNVIYNPKYSGSQITDGYSLAKVNYINNYMITGVDSTSDHMISALPFAKNGFELFVEGNISSNRSSNTMQENIVVKPKDFQWNTAVRYSAPEVTTYSCNSLKNCEAYTKVLENAGAVLPRRDAVDKRIIAEVESGAGKIIDAQSEKSCYLDCRVFLVPADYTKHGILDRISDDGWPVLDAGIPITDNDQDGMADEWERDRGLDPSINDSAELSLHAGYTNIEIYLNEVAGDSTARMR